MYSSVLITGGAGFIGTYLIKLLSVKGYVNIIVIDNLHPQIHGRNAVIDPVLDSKISYFYQLDITNKTEVAKVIKRHQPELVIHLAAETGTGQSYDSISRYVNTNVQGTAILIDLLRQYSSQTKKIILASSRAVYGEGAYIDQSNNRLTPDARDYADMQRGLFEHKNLTSVATCETDAIDPASIYGSTKLMQEYLINQGFSNTNIQVIILRFQNVYGKGQALNNPYTGVLCAFVKAIYNNAPINIFEDGLISRDFVHVQDIAVAIEQAISLDKIDRNKNIINIGSGVRISILHIAQLMLKISAKQDNLLQISGDFRVGDIRHALSDIKYARQLLDFKTSISLQQGLVEFVRDGFEQLAES